MATHDYVISNGTGAAVRADLNNALAAIVSNNSSSSEPATKYAYQWWADTNSGILKIRNSTNNGWVELLQLDGTLTLEDGTESAPGLAFRDDLDTGIFSEAANEFNITTAGGKRLSIDGSGRVGIAADPVTDKLEVGGAIRSVSGSANFSAGPQGAILDYDSSANIARVGSITGASGSARPLVFVLGGVEKARFSSTGQFLIGDTNNPSGVQMVIDGGDVKHRVESGEVRRIFFINGTGGYNLGTTGGAAIGCVGISDGGGVSQEIIFETHHEGSFHGEVMRITKAGRVAIGLSSQVVSKLYVSGGSFSVSGSDANFGAGGNRVFLDQDANNVRFGSTGGGSASTRGIAFYTSNGGTGTDQRMLLDASGDLMIGTTDEEPGRGDTNVGCSIRSDGRIFSSVTSFSSFNRNSDGAVVVFARSGTDVGNISVTASGTTYNPTSDYRLKENVVDITDGIEKVKKLKPYRYNFSTDPAKKVIDGFFAHEVSDIVAGAATGYKDEVVTQEGLDEGKYDNKKSVGDIVAQGLDYSRLTPILTAALQEAIEKIEILETKVAALEAV